MLEYIKDNIPSNMSTLVVGAIVLFVVIAVVGKLFKDKKEGKGGCGGGCANCPGSGSCNND